MNNDIVQLTDKNGNNVFPIAGAATQDSISKSMLEEGVFEGPELFPAPAEAYVRTNDIVDDAVTSDKLDWSDIITVYTNPSDVFEAGYTTTTGVFMFWKLGKLCGIQRVAFDSHNVSAGGEVVATLKPAFRPINTTVRPYLKIIGVGSGLIDGAINPNGVIQEFASGSGTASTYYGSVCWITS